MSKIGYAIFGRPVGLEVTTNGLFREANLGNNMYLGGLTGEIHLQKGETVSIIKINRESQITILSIFEYAESYGPANRPGGFVGAAVAFKGFPKALVIQDYLSRLIRQTYKLIDPSSRKFLHPSKDNWQVQLPSPDDTMVHSLPYDIKPGPGKNKKFGVQVNAPIQLYILSCLQGFMSNPGFHENFDTCMISSDTSFLTKLKNQGTPLYSPFNLLDYSHFFSTMEKKKISAKEALDSELKSKASQLNQLRQNILTKDQSRISIESEISKIERKKAKLIEELTMINKQKEQRHEQLRLIDDAIYKQNIQLDDIKNHFSLKFKELVAEGPLKRDFQNALLNHEAEITNKIEENNINNNKKYFIIQKKLVAKMLFFFIFIIIFLISSVFLYYFIKEKIIHKNLIGNNDIIELSTSVVNNSKHSNFSKQKLFKFINEIDLNNIESKDSIYIMSYKWQFTDFIPANKTNQNSIISSKNAIKKLERILHKLGADKNYSFKCKEMCKTGLNRSPVQESNYGYLDSLYFLIPVDPKYSVKLKELQYKGSLPDFLKMYLGDKENLYSQANLDPQGPEKDIIHNHFRWMISEINTLDYSTWKKGMYSVPILK